MYNVKFMGGNMRARMIVAPVLGGGMTCIMMASTMDVIVTVIPESCARLNKLAKAMDHEDSANPARMKNPMQMAGALAWASDVNVGVCRAV